MTRSSITSRNLADPVSDGQVGQLLGVTLKGVSSENLTGSEINRVLKNKTVSRRLGALFRAIAQEPRFEVLSTVTLPKFTPLKSQISLPTTTVHLVRFIDRIGRTSLDSVLESNGFSLVPHFVNPQLHEVTHETWLEVMSRRNLKQLQLVYAVTLAGMKIGLGMLIGMPQGAGLQWHVLDNLTVDNLSRDYLFVVWDI